MPTLKKIIPALLFSAVLSGCAPEPKVYDFLGHWVTSEADCPKFCDFTIIYRPNSISNYMIRFNPPADADEERLDDERRANGVYNPYFSNRGTLLSQNADAWLQFYDGYFLNDNGNTYHRVNY